MSQVKVQWVLEKDIFTSYAKVVEYQERDNIAVPVIPLASLAEVVEGLKAATVPSKDTDLLYDKGYTDGRLDILDVLLAMLKEVPHG